MAGRQRRNLSHSERPRQASTRVSDFLFTFYFLGGRLAAWGVRWGFWLSPDPSRPARGFRAAVPPANPYYIDGGLRLPRTIPRNPWGPGRFDVVQRCTVSEPHASTAVKGRGSASPTALSQAGGRARGGGRVCRSGRLPTPRPVIFR